MRLEPRMDFETGGVLLPERGWSAARLFVFDDPCDETTDGPSSK